jgi:hypothetical protein
VRAAAGGGALSEERDRKNGDDENDAEQCETGGVAHERGLGADRLADGDDGTVQRSRRIGEPRRLKYCCRSASRLRVVLIPLKNWDCCELRERIADGMTLRAFTEFYCEEAPTGVRFSFQLENASPAYRLDAWDPNANTWRTAKGCRFFPPSISRRQPAARPAEWAKEKS